MAEHAGGGHSGCRLACRSAASRVSSVRLTSGAWNDLLRSRQALGRGVETHRGEAEGDADDDGLNGGPAIGVELGHAGTDAEGDGEQGGEAGWQPCVPGDLDQADEGGD